MLRGSNLAPIKDRQHNILYPAGNEVDARPDTSANLKAAAAAQIRGLNLSNPTKEKRLQQYPSSLAVREKLAMKNKVIQNKIKGLDLHDHTAQVLGHHDNLAPATHPKLASKMHKVM